MPVDSNVVVAVRVRPFNQREIGRGATNVISMNGACTTISNPERPDEPGRAFTFDYSYWSFDDAVPGRFASQELLMKDIGGSLVDNALEGYNTSIFAYGQTGSGKSYSMMGGDEDPGIIPRICNTLFERLDARQAGKDANHSNRIEVSYLEIYNEAVRDLLNPSGARSLKVREHPTLGVFVEDLRTILVTTYAEVEKMIDVGQRTRTVASTAMNATSSRSHSIFSVVVTQTRLAGKDASSSAALASDVTSKVNLVDLAGSERQSSTGAVGDRLKEGCAINKSLSALGNVISALAENCNPGSKKAKFVPYRDSVLTRLLQQSLGGNSKTAMIAALSPADINYEETLSTLRYADRAKRIVNKAVINEEPNERLIRELRAEIERLRALLEAQNQSGASAPGTVVDPAVIAERDRLREEMAAQQKLIETMSMSAEARLRQQSEMGLDAIIGDLSGAAGSGARSGPHFINLHEDPALSEKVAYALKTDKGDSVTFGRRDASVKDPDHELRGLGVGSPHCTITAEGDGKFVITPAQAGGGGAGAGGYVCWLWFLVLV
jgi:kinesin family protein 1